MSKVVILKEKITEVENTLKMISFKIMEQNLLKENKEQEIIIAQHLKEAYTNENISLLSQVENMKNKLNLENEESNLIDFNYIIHNYLNSVNKENDNSGENEERDNKKTDLKIKNEQVIKSLKEGKSIKHKFKKMDPIFEVLKNYNKKDLLIRLALVKLVLLKAKSSVMFFKSAENEDSNNKKENIDSKDGLDSDRYSSELMISGENADNSRHNIKEKDANNLNIRDNYILRINHKNQFLVLQLDSMFDEWEFEDNQCPPDKKSLVVKDLKYHCIKYWSISNDFKDSYFLINDKNEVLLDSLSIKEIIETSEYTISYREETRIIKELKLNFLDKNSITLGKKEGNKKQENININKIEQEAIQNDLKNISNFNGEKYRTLLETYVDYYMIWDSFIYILSHISFLKNLFRMYVKDFLIKEEKIEMELREAERERKREIKKEKKRIKEIKAINPLYAESDSNDEVSKEKKHNNFSINNIEKDENSDSETDSSSENENESSEENDQEIKEKKDSAKKKKNNNSLSKFKFKAKSGFTGPQFKEIYISVYELQKYKICLYFYYLLYIFMIMTMCLLSIQTVPILDIVETMQLKLNLNNENIKYKQVMPENDEIKNGLYNKNLMSIWLKFVFSNEIFNNFSTKKDQSLFTIGDNIDASDGSIINEDFRKYYNYVNNIKFQFRFGKDNIYENKKIPLVIKSNEELAKLEKLGLKLINNNILKYQSYLNANSLMNLFSSGFTAINKDNAYLQNYLESQKAFNQNLYFDLIDERECLLIGKINDLNNGELLKKVREYSKQNPDLCNDCLTSKTLKFNLISKSYEFNIKKNEINNKKQLVSNSYQEVLILINSIEKHLLSRNNLSAMKISFIITNKQSYNMFKVEIIFNKKMNSFQNTLIITDISNYSKYYNDNNKNVKFNIVSFSYYLLILEICILSIFFFFSTMHYVIQTFRYNYLGNYFYNFYIFTIDFLIIILSGMLLSSLKVSNYSVLNSTTSEFDYNIAMNELLNKELSSYSNYDSITNLSSFEIAFNAEKNNLYLTASILNFLLCFRLVYLLGLSVRISFIVNILTKIISLSTSILIIILLVSFCITFFSHVLVGEKVTYYSDINNSFLFTLRSLFGTYQDYLHLDDSFGLVNVFLFLFINLIMMAFIFSIIKQAYNIEKDEMKRYIGCEFTKYAGLYTFEQILVWIILSPFSWYFIYKNYSSSYDEYKSLYESKNKGNTSNSELDIKKNSEKEDTMYDFEKLEDFVVQGNFKEFSVLTITIQLRKVFLIYKKVDDI